MNVTTDELAGTLLESIAKWTPEEKAAARRTLDKQFTARPDGREVALTTNRCRRSNGTFRAWFATYEEARLFALAHPGYQGDVPVRCTRPECFGYHLSRKDWPDSIAERN